MPKANWSYVNVTHPPFGEAKTKGRVWISAMETEYSVDGFGPWSDGRSSYPRAREEALSVARAWGYTFDEA